MPKLFCHSRRVPVGIVLLSVLATMSAVADAEAVAALGRLEPEHGVMRITAPVSPEATTGMVLGELLVDPGDVVAAGDLIAVTETAPLLQALLEEARADHRRSERRAAAATGGADAECVRAEVFRREAERRARLLSQSLSSVEETERAIGEADFREAACRAARLDAEATAAEVEVAAARVKRAEAAFDRSQVRAPVDGMILEVNARPGEFVGRDGIVELGRVQRMYAIAEVYETDIGRVRVGQTATVRSAVLERPLAGVVEHIRLQVRKQDQLGTDPAARKDARIVEVEILLEDGARVAGLSHLQVEVVIGR